MTQTIKLKRSSVPGKVPDISQLDFGEIAINVHDGKLYLKREFEALGEEVVEIANQESIDADLSMKVDKVIAPVIGNFASLLLDGNIADSGLNAGSFATSAQGALADTALQPGDNVSLLVNDAGYITIADTFSGDYNDLTNIPTEFTPEAHTHVKADITDFNEADYATAAQGLLADSALQAGDNVSLLVNDAGYITIADTFSGDYNDLTNIPTEFNPAPHTHTKSEIIDFNDADYATAAQGVLADSALQAGDNVSLLVNDAGYITIADTFSGSYNDLTDVPTEFNPSAHTHVKVDITDFNDADYATAAQGLLADSALQAGDNVSLLVNDAGYITIADTFSGSYNDLTDVPTEFNPSPHTHIKADITDFNEADYATAIHTHVKANITDFNEADYATAEQGALADTALQPGDNVSELVNDANYLSFGDNVSSLANDVGYITDITSEALGDLQDVIFSGAPQENQVLKYVGGAWTASADVGENNSAANIGNGIGIYDSKLNTQLRFRSIIAGQNVNIIDNGSDITINATVSGGGNGLNDALTQVSTESGTYAATGADSFNIIGVGSALNTSMINNTVNISLNAFLNTLGDVNVGIPTTNQYLTFDGSNWTNKSIEQSDVDNLVADLAKKISEDDSINRLDDVNTSNGTNFGQVLSWNGSHWAPRDALDISVKADKVLNATNGHLASLDSTGNLVDSGASLNDLATSAQGDLADSALQPGDLVSELVNDANYMAVEQNSINDLSDVNSIGVATGQVLKWNGFQWIPADDDIDAPVMSVFGRTGDIIASVGDYTASIIEYSNVNSGLSATRVQGAIDELDTVADGLTNRIVGLEDNSHTHNNKVILDAIATSGSGQIITTSERNTLLSALQPGDNVSELANDAGYLTSISSLELNDLSDVMTLGASDGEVLKYFGGTWTASLDTAGEANLMANVGGGARVFKEKDDITFLLRTIRGSASIEVIEVDDELVLQAAIQGAYTTVGADVGEDILALGQDKIDYTGGTGITTRAEITGTQEVDKRIIFDWDASIGDLNDVDLGGLQAGHILVYTGFEWITKANEGGATTFTELTDTPANYEANKLVSVNSTGNGLVYVDAPSGAVDSVFGRTGVVNAEAGDYASFYATIAQGLLADSALQPGDNVSELVNDAGYLTTISTERLSDLLDVSDDTPDAGNVLSFNGTEWVPAVSEAVVTQFVALSDTPSDYTGQAGKMVVVTENEDALEFVDVPVDPPAQITSLDFGTFADVNARLDAGTF